MSRGEIKLVAKAEIPGNSADKSNLEGTLAGGIPHNQLGGFSSIAYSGKDDIYWLLSDRGPADGATTYSCRIHQFRIPVPKAGEAWHPELLATMLLKDEDNRQLKGSSAAFDAQVPQRSTRFDPEAVRIGRDGLLFISDEYGPLVGKFNLEGRRVGRLPLSPKFGIQHPHADPLVEAMLNKSGRQPNAGLEALGISPDGSQLFAIFQRALIQDGGQRGQGENIRMLQIPVQGGPIREFVYRLDDVKSGINECLAVNDHEFLTIERDSGAGDLAVFKKIMHIDLKATANEQATDVSQIEKLPPGPLPATVHPVKKRVFLDLLDPKFGLKGSAFPEKHEGICFAPKSGEEILMIAVSDNDFVTEKPSTLQLFSITPDELPNYTAQQFDK